jgi:hypothetical protein
VTVVDEVDAGIHGFVSDFRVRGYIVCHSSGTFPRL